MKALNGKPGRIGIYLIEACRHFHLMAISSYDELAAELPASLDDNIDNKKSIKIFSLVWQFIDTSFRVLSLLDHIRSIKHNTIEYKKISKYTKQLLDIRNYSQHLNSHIPSITDDIYPVLGALNWRTSDKSGSITIFLGTVPPQTTFNSLGYDTQEKEYVPGIIFNVIDKALNLSECRELIDLAIAYLDSALISNGWINDDIELAPNILLAQEPDKDILLKIQQRFVRIKLKLN